MNSPFLSRRRWLQGLGALGLGAGLAPRLRAQGTVKPKLLIYASASGWLVGHSGTGGIEGWLPPSLHSGGSRAEADFGSQVVEVLAPLQRHAEDVLVVDGFSGSQNVGAHQQAVVMLTGGGIRNNEPARAAGGDGDFHADQQSIDQAIAEALGSRVFGLAHNIDGFQRGEGYLSHTESGRPFIPIQDQGEAYSRVFGAVGGVPVEPGAPDTSAERQRRVLAYLRGDLTRLEGELPIRDHSRLAEHRRHLATLEGEIRDPEMMAAATCMLGEAPGNYGARDPSNVPRQMRDYGRLMIDAMACDYTQVGFIQAGNLEGSNRAEWPEFGVDTRFNEHAISHKFDGQDGAGSDGLSQADARRMAVRVQQMHSTLFAELLDGLKEQPDVDGSPMLDNTLVLHVKPMGRNHGRNRWMWVVAGG
ncbi:MAG: DUF1552 domain-containing protein, partial [Myxococcota bacterium]